MENIFTMSNQVTFTGNAFNLVGDFAKVGQKAPDFSVLDNSLQAKSLKDYAGKTLIISVVPSLDTGVCDAQTRRFNQEAANLSDDIRILTISVDLPFAQARWCGAAGIDKVETLSDHNATSFGNAYGLLVKELRLLARAVLVINKNGDLVYQEVVPEMTNPVNFDAALEAAKKAL